MKKITEITGKDILQEYIRMYEDIQNENDFYHFSKVFERWRIKLINDLSAKKPMELSLNKDNFLGKKTRALLRALGQQEPKTLELLMKKFTSETI